MTAPKKNTDSLVSVVIPTYNRANFLLETVESVLAQTWPNVETIVVDDGSTDATCGILKPYLDRVSYFYQENRGRSSARNLGVAKSSGRYLVFLDSDDLLLPSGLEVQALFLERNPDVDVVYANGFTLDECDRFGSLEPFIIPTPSLDRFAVYSRLIKMNLFALHAGMVRRSALPVDGPFDETMHALEDRDLWTRIALAGCTIRYQDEKAIVYRRHGSNTNLSFATELHSRVIIARKVISKNLDSNLPIRLRQEFRLEYLYAVLASGSPQLLREALRTILFPEGNLSSVGLMGLFVRIVTMAGRMFQIIVTRAIKPIFNRALLGTKHPFR